MWRVFVGNGGIRKRLAATVGILLAVGLPIHGQKETPKPGSNQHDSNAATSPTPPLPKVKCVIKEDGTTIECDYPQAHAPSYLTRLFSAENLPNLLLVLVGVVGIPVAICTVFSINRQGREMKLQRVLMGNTLAAIKRQAGTMEEQTGLLQGSVEAAKKSADAAIKNVQVYADKERAHLIARPALDENTTFSKGSTSQVNLYIRNLGISRALDIACYASAISGPEAKHPAQWPMVMSRNIIQPTEEDGDYITAQVSLVDGHDVAGLDSEVDDPSLFFIEIKGILTYIDIFQIAHEHRFRYQYQVKSAYVSAERWSIHRGAWEKTGKEDNRDT